MEIVAFNETGHHFFSQSMTETELLGCIGGKIPAGVWWAVASLIISSWQDIREGFSDGVSGKPARY